MNEDQINEEVNEGEVITHPIQVYLNEMKECLKFMFPEVDNIIDKLNITYREEGEAMIREGLSRWQNTIIDSTQSTAYHQPMIADFQKNKINKLAKRWSDVYYYPHFVTEINIIGSSDENGVYGVCNKDGEFTIPYYCSSDLQQFRTLTENNIIIMGVNTFLSLPKILPNRLHVVIYDPLKESSALNDAKMHAQAYNNMMGGEIIMFVSTGYLPSFILKVDKIWKHISSIPDRRPLDPAYNELFEVVKYYTGKQFFFIGGESCWRYVFDNSDAFPKDTILMVNIYDSLISPEVVVRPGYTYMKSSFFKSFRYWKEQFDVYRPDFVPEPLGLDVMHYRDNIYVSYRQTRHRLLK